MSDDFLDKKVVANDIKSATNWNGDAVQMGEGSVCGNQTEAQRSGFGLERRSDGMNER